MASRRERVAELKFLLPYLGVIAGLLVLTSPVIADIIETWRSTQSISTATSQVKSLPEDVSASLLGQAQAYNADLVAHTKSDGVLPYEQQLVANGSTMLCWVEIPKIDIRLRVYHGTGEDELMAGAGHIEGTSLPVGGASTHCAISAHSGMPTARMFDDLHDLENGDVFVLWTLDEPYAYEVTHMEVVEPGVVDPLAIVPGEDLCTLVTCTPYGINSHRLLVQGRRCPYEVAQEVPTPAMYVSPRVWPLVTGLVVSGGTLAFLSIRLILKRHRKKLGEEKS